MTLDERKQIAHDLRKQGYNCAQCVLLAFSDIHKLDTQHATQISIALGGGIGGQGNVCGVVNAMAITSGFLTSGKADDKKLAYSTTKFLSQKFIENNGSIICRELKSIPQHRPCDLLIENGIEILHNYIRQVK